MILGIIQHVIGIGVVITGTATPGAHDLAQKNFENWEIACIEEDCWCIMLFHVFRAELSTP